MLLTMMEEKLKFGILALSQILSPFLGGHLTKTTVSLGLHPPKYDHQQTLKQVRFGKYFKSIA